MTAPSVEPVLLTAEMAAFVASELFEGAGLYRDAGEADAYDRECYEALRAIASGAAVVVPACQACNNTGTVLVRADGIAAGVVPCPECRAPASRAAPAGEGHRPVVAERAPNATTLSGDAAVSQDETMPMAHRAVAAPVPESLSGDTSLNCKACRHPLQKDRDGPDHFCPNPECKFWMMTQRGPHGGSGGERG